MKLERLKQFALDFLYGTVALVAMNGVISFLVYPYIYRVMGDAGQGQVLFFTSIMGLMASAFGSGANYARMKISTLRHSENGDYNWFLLGVAALSVIVTLLAVLIKGDSAGSSVIMIAVLIIVTIVRYYADVQFRLDLNYRGFFFYYILIAMGYVIGVLLYPVTHSWPLILILGECFGLIYVTAVGSVFKAPFLKRSLEFKQNICVMGDLSTAYFMSDFVSYADRLLIPMLLGDAASTVFYAATLIGKTVSLLSTPLNGVIVGHLSKYQGRITRKMFAGIAGILLACTFVFTGASVLASWIVIPILYPDVITEAGPLFWAANAAQVFFFISNTMMVVVLRFATEKYQVYMGVVYTVLFFAIIIPSLYFGGLWGMALGLLTINVLKFFIITALGFHALNDQPAREEL